MGRSGKNPSLSIGKPSHPSFWVSPHLHACSIKSSQVASYSSLLQSSAADSFEARAGLSYHRVLGTEVSVFVKRAAKVRVEVSEHLFYLEFLL